MNEESNAGEVELLLSDASAVEEKIVKVLIKLFGGSGDGDTRGARRWLFGSLINDPEVNAHLTYIIRREIDQVRREHEIVQRQQAKYGGHNEHDTTTTD